MSALYLGIDVGTLSARAGLFDKHGTLVSVADAAFSLLRPQEHHAVYRMDDIWAAVLQAARECVAAARAEGHDPYSSVAAMAFDATSSLALQHTGPRPLAGDADVFCWMDHRGEAEAEAITATGDRVLAYTGGTTSPEIHLPKLLWLKRHDPAAFATLTAARDLVDELGFRATGAGARSLCGLACKWPYLPNDAEPWRHSLLAGLGVGEIAGLGGAGDAAPVPVGGVHGRLSATAAKQLGLRPGLPVAAGLIDAEAGTLGVVGPDLKARMNRTAALIGGTSTCFMAFAPDERRVPGVWGPFKDAVFPGFWLHEAGQSFSGAALDAVLTQHPGGPRSASPEAHAAAASEVAALLAQEGPAFAARRHIVPDWLGNRSPLGDGRVRAMSSGLGEETGRRACLEAYYATARALALQARHVLDHLDQHGYALTRVALAGGHAKNPMMIQLYRDCLTRTLVLTDAPEPVLLGAAMVAACAAGAHRDLFAAVDAMCAPQRELAPDAAAAAAHAQNYAIYRRMFDLRNDIEAQAAALDHAARNAREGERTA